MGQGGPVISSFNGTECVRRCSSTAMLCLARCFNAYAEVESNSPPELVKSMNRMLDEKSNKICIKGFFFSKQIFMYCSCLVILLKISWTRDHSEFGPLTVLPTLSSLLLLDKLSKCFFFKGSAN